MLFFFLLVFLCCSIFLLLKEILGNTTAGSDFFFFSFLFVPLPRQISLVLFFPTNAPRVLYEKTTENLGGACNPSLSGRARDPHYPNGRRGSGYVGALILGCVRATPEAGRRHPEIIEKGATGLGEHSGRRQAGAASGSPSSTQKPPVGSPTKLRSPASSSAWSSSSAKVMKTLGVIPDIPSGT